MKKTISMLLAVMMVVTAYIPLGAAEPTFAGSGTSSTIEEMAEQLQDPSNDPYSFRDDKARAQAKKRSGDAALDLRHMGEDTDGDGRGDTSYVTPIKCQAPFGTCWGFAAIAAAETSILGEGLQGEEYAAEADEEKGIKEFDLSEKHLAYFVVTPLNRPSNPHNGEGIYVNSVVDGLNNGGLPVLATNTFSTGIGPNLENRLFEDIAGDNEILRYKGFKIRDDGTTDYRNSTSLRERVDGKWVQTEYSDEDDWSLPEDLRFKQSYVLSQSYMLPSPADGNEDGINAIKEQLLAKRGVEIGYYCLYNLNDDKAYICMNEDTWAHYTPVEANANHAVTIIGWDDRYPKENFYETPEGDGAWLVKNSWGADTREFPHNSQRHWGLLEGQDDYDSSNGETEHYAAVSDKHTGYFWLSYYDKSISSPEALEFDESNDGTSYILDQHDYMPVYEMNGAVVENETKMANVFRTEYGQTLRQVSCQTQAPGTKVSYAVYLLQRKTSAPEDGLLVASSAQPVEYKYGGFHKLTLDEPVMMSRGQYYSIVITEQTSDGKYAVNIPMGRENVNEQKTSGQLAIINKNESYLFIDGEWKDYSDKDLREQLLGSEADKPCDNFAIKGYSKETGNDYHLKIETISDVYSIICPFAREGYPAEWTDQSFIANLTGSDEIPDGAEIRWSQSEGSEELFGLSVDPSSDSVTIKAKNAGTGYLIAEVAGVGMAAMKIIVTDLTIYNMVLPQEVFVYTGDQIRPKITPRNLMMTFDAIDSELLQNLEEGVDYLVGYENNTKCGKATVTVTANAEHFTGSATENYMILPQKSEISKVTAGVESVTVEFVSQEESGISGYEVLCVPSGEQEGKTVDVPAGSTSAVISGLSAGKKYDVSVRAYVLVDDEKEYGEVSETVVSPEPSAAPAPASTAKAAETPTVRGKTVEIDHKSLKKKSRTLKLTEVIEFTNDDQGKKTYRLVSATKGKKSFKKYFKINKKTGKVTVKKGLKKGTYAVKVKIKASGSTTVTFTVKVK